MKLNEILLVVGLSLFVAACSEPQPKISKLYHDKWNEKLSEMGIEKLKICFSFIRRDIAITSGSCIFRAGKYQFEADKKVVRIMAGTDMKKVDNQWRVFPPDNIEKRISLQDALQFLNKATETLVAEREQALVGREDNKSTWK